MSFKGVIGDIVETGRGDDTFSCEWRIPDFLSLAGKGGDLYQSPSFDACGGRWFFRIYPKGLRGSTSGWVSFILFSLGAGPPQTLDVTLAIRGAEGVENKRKRMHEFFYDDCACFWYSFCSRRELGEQKSRLMPNNVLIISLDMKSVVPRIAREADALLRSEQNVLKSGEDSEVTLKEQGTEELKESLKGLLVSGKDSDVIVKVQGKKFPAHRLVLQARSPVFEAMFSHDMVEKQKGVVTMEDCDQETFPDFLEHVYTGSVEMISSDNVFSLFAASDKYDLKTLKKACAEFLKKNLTVTSFCDTVTLAIKYDEKELMELATEFFCSHSLEICKTVEWQVFLTENPIVGNELIIKVNEQLKKEVESLIEQNKDLHAICEEQTHNISKASSELRKACMDNESHKKEMESLMKQIEILKRTVENYQTRSENYSKQMSTMESELISSAEQYKCQEKLTIFSELEKAAIDDDAVEKNNNDEDHEESKNKKNVKQQVKRTKKISLPARHGDVIRSLKSILAGGRRADFSLKSGGGEWRVHRAILEGRSGHFGALFWGEWAERSEVRLDDVPEGALAGVLHFAYAGEVGDLSPESVCGTRAAARRFDMRDLESLCVECMGERMGPETVCGALAVDGGGDLKQRALECFFRESGRVVATEGWRELKEKHPAVIGELFREFIKRERTKRRKE